MARAQKYPSRYSLVPATATLYFYLSKTGILIENGPFRVRPLHNKRAHVSIYIAEYTQNRPVQHKLFVFHSFSSSSRKPITYQGDSRYTFLRGGLNNSASIPPWPAAEKEKTNHPSIGPCIHPVRLYIIRNTYYYVSLCIYNRARAYVCAYPAV